MSEWISVKERLPQDSRAVLVCWKNDFGISIESYRLYDLEQAGLITHWQPLPPVPSEEE